MVIAIIIIGGLGYYAYLKCNPVEEEIKTPPKKKKTKREKPVPEPTPFRKEPTIR